MVDLPIAPFARIARKHGAERVSDEAAQRLARAAEEYAGKIVAEAAGLAGHAGRKTLKIEDVELAIQKSG